MTVNSGGEKIFVEEVERAIAGHPAVADVVVDRPSVGALGLRGRGGGAAGRGGPASADSASIVEHASAHIARYKLPKEVVFVERIQRSPSGKADYRWAAETAVKARAGGVGDGGGGGRRTRGRGRASGSGDHDGAAGVATVHRRGPGALRRAERTPPRRRVAGLVAHPGRERRPGGPLRRGDGPRGLGAVGGRGRRAGRPSSAWSGLHRVNAALPCAPAVEVGWRLHPDHWGHGYATEAATASLAYGFGEAGLERDRRHHHDAQHPLAGGHGPHRDGARPRRRLRPPELPRGQPAAAPRALPGQRVTGPPYAWRHERRRRGAASGRRATR